MLSLAGEPRVEKTRIAGEYVFTGCHFIEDEVLDRIPEGRFACIVRDVYRELAAELRRVKELLFGAMKELPEGNVIRSTYLDKYEKERPRWA